MLRLAFNDFRESSIFDFLPKKENKKGVARNSACATWLVNKRV